MVTSYHSTIQKGIILAGKELTEKHKRIKGVFRGEEMNDSQLLARKVNEIIDKIEEFENA